MMDKRKLDGTVDKSSAEQHIRKSEVIVKVLEWVSCCLTYLPKIFIHTF